MKIGIITFWKSKDNYGQILQSFALQQYLLNYGHEPFLIRYQDNPKEEASFKISRFFVYLLKIPTYLKWYIQQKMYTRKIRQYENTVAQTDRHFDDFMKANIAHTQDVYTEQLLAQKAPEADAYICGSDQIWAGDWAYYLNFASDDKPKIAYAPSLGGITTFNPDYEHIMTGLLKRFSFIGMREDSGVEVCRRLGRKDATKVVDPTLLLTRANYDKIRINTKEASTHAYILLYILGNPMACKLEDIYLYAQKRSLEVKYVASSGQADKYEHYFPQVGEWIDLIANAEMVITNSFHGTVFALLYEKNFITIPLNQGYERMNTRVIELLKATNLSDHLYGGNFDIMPKDADFSCFRNYRAAEEMKSESYIKPFIPIN